MAVQFQRAAHYEHAAPDLQILLQDVLAFHDQAEMPGELCDDLYDLIDDFIDRRQLERLGRSLIGIVLFDALHIVPLRFGDGLRHILVDRLAQLIALLHRLIVLIPVDVGEHPVDKSLFIIDVHVIHIFVNIVQQGRFHQAERGVEQPGGGFVAFPDSPMKVIDRVIQDHFRFIAARHAFARVKPGVDPGKAIGEELADGDAGLDISENGDVFPDEFPHGVNYVLPELSDGGFLQIESHRLFRRHHIGKQLAHIPQGGRHGSILLLDGKHLRKNLGHFIGHLPAILHADQVVDQIAESGRIFHYVHRVSNQSETFSQSGGVDQPVAFLLCDISHRRGLFKIGG